MTHHILVSPRHLLPPFSSPSQPQLGAGLVLTPAPTPHGELQCLCTSLAFRYLLTPDHNYANVGKIASVATRTPTQL